LNVNLASFVIMNGRCEWALQIDNCVAVPTLPAMLGLFIDFFTKRRRKRTKVVLGHYQCSNPVRRRVNDSSAPFCSMMTWWRYYSGPCQYIHVGLKCNMALYCRTYVVHATGNMDQPKINCFRYSRVWKIITVSPAFAEGLLIVITEQVFWNRMCIDVYPRTGLTISALIYSINPRRIGKWGYCLPTVAACDKTQWRIYQYRKYM
jgi:hypothetical protein